MCIAAVVKTGWPAACGCSFHDRLVSRIAAEVRTLPEAAVRSCPPIGAQRPLRSKSRQLHRIHWAAHRTAANL